MRSSNTPPLRHPSQYKQHSDGSIEPLYVHTVVISTQHAEPLHAKRTEEQNGKATKKPHTCPFRDATH